MSDTLWRCGVITIFTGAWLLDRGQVGVALWLTALGMFEVWYSAASRWRNERRG